METNKNNESSNKKRYSNKQKLILSGALTLLIAGVSVGGVMLVKDAKLNETNKKLVGIQNKNKTLELQLKTTHDKLTKTINAKLNELNQKLGKGAAKITALKSQIEINKKELDQKLGKDAAKITALKNQIESNKKELATEIKNNDLSDSFLSRFIMTEEYDNALQSYVIKKFKKTNEYDNALQSYIIKAWKKSKAYKNLLEPVFLTSTPFQKLLNDWIGTETKAKLTTEFEKTDKYTEAFNTYAPSVFKKSKNYETAFETWKEAEILNDVNEVKKAYETLTEVKNDDTEVIKKSKRQFKETYTTFDRFLETERQSELLFNDALFESKSEYKIALDTYAEQSTTIEAFKTTKIYKDALQTYQNTKFKTTKIYKDALQTYQNKELEATRDYSNTFIIFSTDGWMDNSATDFILTSEYIRGFEDYKTIAFEATKTYKDALRKYKGSDNTKTAETYEATTEYKNKLDAFIVIETPEKLATAFQATKTYKYTLKAHQNKEFRTTEFYMNALDKWLTPPKKDEFHKTPEYKDAFASYVLKITTLQALISTSTDRIDTLHSMITKSALKKSLSDVFAKKDFSQLTKPTLINKLAEALSDKANTADIYTKTELTTAKLAELLNDVFAKKELTLLNADGTLKDNLKTKIQNLINADKLMKELKKIMLKTDVTTIPDTVKKVIYNIVKNKLIKNIFDSAVVEFKRLDDVTQADHLNNTFGDKNLFYRLAPALFKSVKEANEILSDLLSGSTTKPNTNALWKVGTSGVWKVGTLNDLKAKKDQQYQKVIFIKVGWGVSNNADAKYTPAPAANEKEDTTPTGNKLKTTKYK